MFRFIPADIRKTLTNAGLDSSTYDDLTGEERMAALTRIASHVVDANASIEVTKERPYVVLALEEGINTGGISNVPQRAFQNAEEAARYAQANTTRHRPLFVLKVVMKVEIAPPPTVVTNFDD